MAKFKLLFFFALTVNVARAQHHVDLSASHERILLVVPMIGSGTWADPKRPMFAPVASQIGRDKSGILAFYHELSDDGKSAIVVLVAHDRSTFNAIFASAKTNPSIQVFDRKAMAPQTATSGVKAPTGTLSTVAGTLPAATAALTAVRKDFDWNRFAVRVP